MIEPSERFMRLAIDTARAGAANGDYAVGAVLVRGEEVLAAEHTRIQSLIDPSAHAEVLAIRAGAATLRTIYIPDGVLYTTLEPCAMCSALAVWAKLRGIVYGASLEDGLRKAQERHGERLDWRQIRIKAREVLAQAEPKLELIEGFMRDACFELLQQV